MNLLHDTIKLNFRSGDRIENNYTRKVTIIHAAKFEMILLKRFLLIVKFDIFFKRERKIEETKIIGNH